MLAQPKAMIGRSLMPCAAALAETHPTHSRRVFSPGCRPGHADHPDRGNVFADTLHDGLRLGMVGQITIAAPAFSNGPDRAEGFALGPWRPTGNDREFMVAATWLPFTGQERCRDERDHISGKVRTNWAGRRLPACRKAHLAVDKQTGTTPDQAEFGIPRDPDCRHCDNALDHSANSPQSACSGKPLRNVGIQETGNEQQTGH